MNLKDKFNYLNTRQKILFSVAFILVLIFIVLLVLYVIKLHQKPVEIVEELPIVEEIDEPTVEPETTEEPIVVEPTKVINVIRGSISKINDVGTKALLIIVPYNATGSEEVQVEINTDTEFFDLEDYSKISLNELQEGDKIVVYAPGNYRITVVTADVVLKGDDINFSYGKLKGITQGNDGIQIWSFYDTNDKLKFEPTSIEMLDSYTGEQGNYSGVLTDGSKILYKYNVDFEITENGNFYVPTDLIILSY